MKLTDLQGKSQDEQLAIASQFAGVDPKVMRGLIFAESSWGKNMLSPAGAEGWAQLMPKTRRTWEERFGHRIDPYKFEDSIFTAAHQLKENLGATKGNLVDALRMYNAGTDRTNWNNPETRAYPSRVLGAKADVIEAGASRVKPTTVLDEAAIKALPAGTLLNMRREDIVEAPNKGSKVDRLSVQDMVEAALRGDQKLPGPRDTGTNLVREQQTGVRYAQETGQAITEDYSFGDKFSAAFEDLTVIPGMMRVLDREHAERDPEWDKHWKENWQELEGFAENEEEARRLRGTSSKQDYDNEVEAIKLRRELRGVYARTPGDALIYGGLASLSDPVGLALGVGVGKVLQVAGVGSRALLAGRTAQVAAPEIRAAQNVVSGFAIPARTAVTAVPSRPLAAMGSLALEGAAANVLTDAALQFSGEHKTLNDYALDGAAGILFAGLAAPWLLRGKFGDGLRSWAEQQQVNAATKEAELLVKAQAAAGPDATPEQIAAQAKLIQSREALDTRAVALAPVDDAQRLLTDDAAYVLTNPETEAGAALKKQTEGAYDADKVADPTERDVITELQARAERNWRDNPVVAKGFTVLDKLKFGAVRGFESTGQTLLNGGNKIGRMVAQQLLESTTGAGGRRRTAALTLVQRERDYNWRVSGYESDFQEWRKAAGRGLLTEVTSGGAGRREFDRAVVLEIEARAGNGQRSQSPQVQNAATRLSKAFDNIRLDMQEVNAVGASRLDAQAGAYFPHQLDGAKIIGLTQDQERALRAIYAKQLRDLNFMNKKWVDGVAAKIIQNARDRAYNGGPVPVHLHDPRAGDMVEDALRALNIAEVDVKKAMGKFSRGGASFTKKRLKIDLSADIGDGMKLVDLYNTDVMSVYRQYSRRAAGEVALAQYGVMGRRGLDLIREGMKATGAKAEEIDAFNQIAAEFLNMPYGTAAHNTMDNVRILTSLSRLGGMGFTQLGEYGNALVAIGVSNMLGHVGDVPRLMREIKQIHKTGNTELRTLLTDVDQLAGHIGLDEYQLQRYWDLPADTAPTLGREELGIASRAIRGAGNLQAMLSAHRLITAVQRRGMAEQVVRKVMKYARDGGDDKALRDMGLSPELQAKIKADLYHIATWDTGGNLKDLNLRASRMDAKDIKELVDTIDRGVFQIIQGTYIGETGKWAHSSLLKLLLQFRTFGVTAVEKQWGRNNKNYGALKAFGIIVGGFSIAAPIHLARVNAKTVGMSEADREEYLDANLNPGAFTRSLLGYVSAAGLSGDVYDVGVGTLSSWFGDDGEDFAEAVGVRGAGNKRLLGGVVAPGVSQIEDMWSVTQGDPHRAIKALPFSNLPYLQPLVNISKDMIEGE